MRLTKQILEKKKKQIIEGSVQKPDAVLAKIYPCYI